VVSNRKQLKRAVYSAILVVPFLVLVFHPKNLKAPALLDNVLKPAGILQKPLLELKKLFYYRETYEEYLKYKRQAEVLKSRLVLLQERFEENKRYEIIQDFRRTQDFASIVADVVGRDPSNWNASLIINRGQSSGLKSGQPVVSPLGVLGKIIETGKTTSKVILLSDPNFAVAALVQRTRENGLLTGTLQGLCRLQYLTEKADVKVGDKIITSKMSSAFPEGILIGTVVDVQASSNSHTVECLVEPAVDLSQVEEVIVIKK
jgi:rod shape-determining protein MreC